MIQLKTLSHEAVPAALELAERYRLLGEPDEAQSICRDILVADPGNGDAKVTLLLALTDNFIHELSASFSEATEIALQLSDDYRRAYYTGIIFERRAKAHLRQNGPGAGQIAFDWLNRAMETFEKAIGEHRLGTACAFFAGLKNEVYRAREIARFRQVACSAEQHRRVPVMAAGVHLAGVAARVWNTCCLDDRQSIHVSAQPKGAWSIALTQNTNDTSATNAAVDFYAP